MSSTALKTLVVVLGGLLLIAAILLIRPGYFASPEILVIFIVAQIVIAALCKYRQVFFVILMAAFLWAGINMPFHGAWLQGRWFVLGVGALAGLAIYMKDKNQRFGQIHMVAFFCVLSAVVSAMVSSYPEESFLKAASLFLLFVYASSGARLAVPWFSPQTFFRGLLRVCEFLAYFTAVSYYILRWEVYGTSNALGAVMGVVVIPVILWGFLTAETVGARRRLGFELLLAMLILMSSFCRAGIASATISCVAVCISHRQYRLVVKGMAAVVVLAISAVTFVPQQSEAPKGDSSQSLAEMFLYKGKPEGGVLGSRQGPWAQTWAVIKDNPWFGSGFGTSQTTDDLTNIQFAYGGSHVDTRVIREHGNSYLAIGEWVGLLGVIPFYFLIVLTAANVRSVFSRLRRTGNMFSPMVPAAAILLAGLVDAGFEDGLFAVGYYLCVFFWSLAFILDDLIHASDQIVYRTQNSMSGYEQFTAVASAR